jgi:hypothetical protein
MSYYPADIFPTQWVDPDTGELASGFTLEAYLGGTSTPTNMFTNKSGTSAGTTITFNSGGFPEVSGSVVTIWLQTGIEYKFILKDASGNTKWTIDNTRGFSTATVETYAAMRALPSGGLPENTIITVTGNSTVGYDKTGRFVVKDASVTDNKITLFVFDDDATKHAPRS